jgi:hypothetical protein
MNCRICGRELEKHDRVDLRRCQTRVQEQTAMKRGYRPRPETVARILEAEQTGEARGFLRGTVASRALLLRWAIKVDTFLPHADKARYRCLECSATWLNTRDAHPYSEECAVGQILNADVEAARDSRSSVRSSVNSAQKEQDS